MRRASAARRYAEEALAMRNHLGAERVVRPEVPRVYAAISATPFSSVLMAMIVLLCLSMAPTLHGLDVGLPVAAPASFDGYTRQVVVEMTADRAIALNNTTITLAELEGRLREIFATRRDKTLYVIGAGSLRYGDVIPLIDAAYGAGAHRVGIVTERMLAISRGLPHPNGG